MSTAGSAKPRARRKRRPACGRRSAVGDMPRKVGGSIIAASSALLPLACAIGGGGSPQGEPSIDPGPVVVEVNNRNWLDMHIYVVASGQRWSLGQVTSHSTGIYELPEGVFASGNDVVLMADPIGSNVAYRSDPILLERGDRVQWNLAHRLSHSSLFVF